MTRLERYHLLCYFGSGQPIPWTTLIQIGTLYIADPTTGVRNDIHITKRVGGRAYYQWEFQRMLKDALRNNLVKRVDNAQTLSMRREKAYLIEDQDFSFQITPKGDECLRAEQMARGGESSYYKGFDRTVGNHADNIMEPPRFN